MNYRTCDRIRVKVRVGSCRYTTHTCTYRIGMYIQFDHCFRSELGISRRVASRPSSYKIAEVNCRGRMMDRNVIFFACKIIRRILLYAYTWRVPIHHILVLSTDPSLQDSVHRWPLVEILVPPCRRYNDEPLMACHWELSERNPRIDNNRGGTNYYTSHKLHQK